MFRDRAPRSSIARTFVVLACVLAASACSSCEDKQPAAKDAAARAPDAEATSDAGGAALDADASGADASGRSRAPTPLSDDEARALADAEAAKTEADRALAKKDHAAALKALERALAAQPDDCGALLSRGRARILAKSYDDAVSDLSRALRCARTAQEAQAIYTAMGEAHEGRGSPEDTRLAYARAYELGRNDLLEKKLNMKLKCSAEIDRTREPAVVARTWLEAWDRLAEAAKRDLGAFDGKKPESEVDARETMCVEGCQGKGPFVARVADAKGAKHFFVTPVDGPKLVFYGLDAGRAGACAGETKRRHEVVGKVFHVHIAKSFEAREIVLLEGGDAGAADGGAAKACASGRPRDGGSASAACGYVCAPASWEEVDLYFDPVVRTRFAAVIEQGIPDAQGAHKQKLDISHENGNAVVRGLNCDNRIALTALTFLQQK